MQNQEENDQLYKVVINHEEQYSIWPAERESPPGWNDVGKTGPKAECLSHIKEVWTDLRPLSLRKRMESAGTNPDPSPAGAKKKAQMGEDLVTRLCRGEQVVEARTFPERSAAALKESIERRYVHLKFDTIYGGTELGIALDPKASDLTKANFESQEGTVTLSGGLTLDFVKLRCVSGIDLKTLKGTSRLERV